MKSLRDSSDSEILEEILRRLGYRYNIDRMAYVNRDERKLFSVEALRQPLWATLKQISAPATEEWQFFCVGGVSESVRRQAVELL